MQIFIAYSSRDREVAEETCLKLAVLGHNVFYDKTSLKPGQEFDQKIRAEIGKSDQFVFLVSPESVRKGNYTLTELKWARERWPHPRGFVLPVLVRQTLKSKIAPYLKQVTLLEPEGNIAAEIAGHFQPVSISTTEASEALRPQVWISRWGQNEDPKDTVGYLLQHGFHLRNSGPETAHEVLVEAFEVPIQDETAVRFKSDLVPVIERNAEGFAPIYREADSPYDRWKLEEYLHAAYRNYGEADQTIPLRIMYSDFHGRQTQLTKQSLIYSPHLRRIRFDSPVSVPLIKNGGGQRWFTCSNGGEIGLAGVQGVHISGLQEDFIQTFHQVQVSVSLSNSYHPTVGFRALWMEESQGTWLAHACTMIKSMRHPKPIAILSRDNDQFYAVTSWPTQPSPQHEIAEGRWNVDITVRSEGREDSFSYIVRLQARAPITWELP